MSSATMEPLEIELPDGCCILLQHIADYGPIGDSPAEVAAYLVQRGLDDMLRCGVVRLSTSEGSKDNGQ